MAVTITRRTSRIRFLSHITKFAFSRVKGSREFSIRKSAMASSPLNTDWVVRVDLHAVIDAVAVCDFTPLVPAVIS